MKRLILIISIALLASVIALAQKSPMGFTYQAVVRDMEGKPLSDKPIGVKITLQNKNGTTKHYTETTTATTTSLGVVNLVVGEGTPVVGSFASVPWELGNIYINVAVDAAGGNNYVSMGSTKLQSVPYALFAGGNGETISGSGQAGRIAYWTGESSLSSLKTLNFDKSLEVTSPSVAGDDDPIFEVKNREGKVVLGVYQTGVRVYVDDTKIKGNRGGFVVGGFSDQTKAKGTDYLRVTPDSVRVNVRNDDTKGNRGGFVVGGFSDQTKKGPKDLLFIAPDSARIYIDDSKTKGNRGGFVVGGFSDQTKGQPNFLQLYPDNYFIGHGAGSSIDKGQYNIFIGYQAGFKTTGDHGDMDPTEGDNNIFIGYKAGYSNINGEQNLYMGAFSGRMNEDGTDNTFVGSNAGEFNTGYSNTLLGAMAGYGLGGSNGYKNTFLGSNAGTNNTSGNSNVFVGREAGTKNTTGNDNVYVGHYTGGINETGSGNVFIGNRAGNMETGSNKLYIHNDNANSNTSLIYGDFSAKQLKFNATRVGINNDGTALTQTLDVNGTVRIRSIGSGAYSTAVNRMADGTFTTSTSDVKLKENISTLSGSLDKVMTLRGVNFTWKSEPGMGNRVGFIAQEVEKVVPELVFTNSEDGYMGVNYAEMTAVLVEAVKEQQQTIINQNEIIETLKTQNEQIMQRLLQIEEQLNK